MSFLVNTADFSAQLLADGEAVHLDRSKDGWVGELKHLTKYAFRLCNYSETARVSVQIEIDGDRTNNYQMAPKETTVLDRPASKANQYQFVAVESKEGAQGGLVKGDSKQGRVSIVFRVEAATVELRRPQSKSKAVMRSAPAYAPEPQPMGFSFGAAAGAMQPMSFSRGGRAAASNYDYDSSVVSVVDRPEGGTVLSEDHSALKFAKAESIGSYDEKKTVYVELRLVLPAKGVQPLHAHKKKAAAAAAAMIDEVD